MVVIVVPPKAVSTCKAAVENTGPLLAKGVTTGSMKVCHSKIPVVMILAVHSSRSLGGTPVMLATVPSPMESSVPNLPPLW